MRNKLPDEQLKFLLSGIVSLENIDEAEAFFDDLCTIAELKAMAQRFCVAKLLKDGEQYLSITQKTGASAATISRVNRSLEYGDDGYKLILSRIEEEENDK